jgi:uncharacterized membrane protein YhaH (DUF805 family)
MTILDATRICLRKAFVFQGRATRAEFWWFSGAVVLAFAAALGLDRLLFPVAMMRGMLPVSAGLFALTAIPMLSAGWRRMHDTGREGIQLLWPLLAYLGFVAALWAVATLFVVLDQHVYDPRVYEAAKILAAIIFPLGALMGLFAGVLILFWLARPGEPRHNVYGPPPDGLSAPEDPE